jgi:hypothetical protein
MTTSNENRIYDTLPDATPEQVADAFSEVERWMTEGNGNTIFYSSSGTAKRAVLEYILFSKGLKLCLST